MKKLFTILISLTFLNSYSAQVSVKDYGAKGDGVSIDSEAIKHAFSSGASMIYFPKGKYNISNCMLFVKSGLTIYGEAGAVILSSDIRFRAGSYPSTIAAAITITGNNVSIHDLSIVSTDDQRSSYVGISIQNSSDVTIRNCTIQGFALMGIRNNGSKRFIFNNNYIKHIGSPNSVLMDSTALTYTAPYGVSGSGSFMKFTNNYIDSIGNWTDRKAYSYGAGIYESGLKIIVSHNRIFEFGAVAIKIFSSRDARISNNIIKTNSISPGSAGCTGIITDEEGQGAGAGAIVNGNTIIAGNDFTYGIYAADGSKKFNIFKNKIYMKSFAVTSGMAFERSEMGNISSNIITANPGNLNKNFGIYITNQFSKPGVAGVRNLSFVNNIISNVAYGYYLSGAQNISILGGKVSMDSIIPSACIFIRPYYVTSSNISISGVTFISKSPGYIYHITDAADSLHVENMDASGNFIYSNGNYWFVGSGNNSIHTTTDHDMLGKCQLNEKYTNIRSSITHSMIKR